MKKRGKKLKKIQKNLSIEDSEIKETEVLINADNDSNKSINNSTDDKEDVDSSSCTTRILKHHDNEVVTCLTEKLTITEKANSSR